MHFQYRIQMDKKPSVRDILSKNIRYAVSKLLKVESPSVTQVMVILKEPGRGTVSEVLHNDRNVGIDKLDQWASELGVNPWQLVMPN